MISTNYFAKNYIHVSQINPNPKLIGAFITGMLILIVGMTLFFGTASFLNRSTHFIVFFDQSINGLKAGSLVKFRGVPVGQVRQIMIRAEGQDELSTAIPVIIEINQSRLTRDLGVSSDVFDPEWMQTAISRGLMAQLNLESFITGQLFVELSFEPDKLVDSQLHLTTTDGLIEIPTLNSSLDQIAADVAKIISNVRDLDLQELNENINHLLVSTAATMDGIDSVGISQALIKAADGVTQLFSSEEFKETLLAVRGALDEVRDTAKSFNLAEGPLAETLDTWTAEITQSLDNLNVLTRDASALLKPGSDTRFELENMLREVSRTARSIRLLSEFLERNPNALLTGRSEED
ncbi:MAG: MCE family protein [Puniceicoccaceae bacterium]|nr:MAG: MCE family protein [Puniceicoccaceae bacterium]